MLAFILLTAATANPATNAANPPAQDPVKKERMVCKTASFVGSHLSQRICKTESEWQAGKEDAQDALDARGRGGNYRVPTGPN